jgi:hypothetical protein
MLQEDDAVGEAPKLQVRVARGMIVEQQHGAGVLGEELLEPENLTTVPKWVPG